MATSASDNVRRYISQIDTTVDPKDTSGYARILTQCENRKSKCAVKLRAMNEDTYVAYGGGTQYLILCDFRCNQGLIQK